MKICFFGGYIKNSPRNINIIKGFKENGVEVIELNDTSHPAIRYIKLFFKYLFLPKHDVIFTNLSRGSALMALFLGKIFKRKVVFDPFVSLYDTLVIDRRLIKSGSLKAKIFYYLDKIPSKIADIVILDTNEHANYFVKEFNLKKDKVKVISASILSIFIPSKFENKGYILYCGSYIPVHGTEYIIEAAKKLEKVKVEINFLFLGNGQDYKKIKEITDKYKLKNIQFIKWVEPEEVPKYIGEADICLGVFGKSEKAKRIIATKVLEYIAMKKPVITGDCEAIRRFFTNKKDILLCKMADSSSLAKVILELKQNEKLKKNIAKEGYKTYQKNFSFQKIKYQCREIINALKKD